MNTHSESEYDADNRSNMEAYVAQASDMHGQLFLLIGIAAIMGLGKGGVPGFATIATAATVATAPLTVSGGLGYAVALQVPILTMIDVYAAWLHSDHLDWPTVRLLLPLSFLGMALGQQIDKHMTDSAARILVGGILLAILTLRVYKSLASALCSPGWMERMQGIKRKDSTDCRDVEHGSSLTKSLPASPSQSHSKSSTAKFGWACIVGLLGGAATMLTNSMGPILNVYLLSVANLSPQAYIGTLQLVNYGVLDNVELIHKLIAIVVTNGHQYYGRPDVAYAEFFGLPGQQGTDMNALFVYGSKVAHSCEPNTAYSSKTADGCLEYKLIRPLKEGDLVTFSYLDKLFATPTHIRRDKLLKSKSFICKCERCVGPDFCRFLNCPTTGCVECMTCVDPGDISCSTTWSCPACGVIDTERVEIQTEKEELIQRELQSMKMKAMFSLSGVPPSSLRSLVARASSQLSPVHYLTLLAMEQLTTVCASLAAQTEHIASMMGTSNRMPRQNPNIALRSEELRLQAAESGFAFVFACECVAAGCNGKHCQVERMRHEPVYECSVELFHACQDLIRVPSKKWPTYAVPMVKRYLPNMRVCFGDDDIDVQNIETQITSKSLPTTAPSDPEGQRSSPSVGQNPPTKTWKKNNRKKKRGKKK